MNMQYWKVPCVDKLDCAVVRGAAHDEGCELSGQRTFQEYSVGCLHHAAEGKVRISEAAECCVQMTHEHGGGDALPGNISAQKEEIAICCKVIAVIAAHYSCRLIVVGEFPALREGMLRWK